MIVFMIIIQSDLTHAVIALCWGLSVPMLIDSLKPFQPAEGDTVITTHSTEKRITQSGKGMLTVNKAAGPGQTLSLQHCLLAEHPQPLQST